jgi:hypothetical protein
VPPFHVRYHLTRGPRLAAYLYAWGPCLAPCLGFTLGISFLATVVSVWFLPLLAVPIGLGRWYLPGLLEIVRHPLDPVELTVDADTLSVGTRSSPARLPLAGVFQVFRAGDYWTVLHAAGPALHIPVASITDEQSDYLKAWARRVALARRPAAETGGRA